VFTDQMAEPHNTRSDLANLQKPSAEAGANLLHPEGRRSGGHVGADNRTPDCESNVRCANHYAISLDISYPRCFE